MQDLVETKPPPPPAATGGRKPDQATPILTQARIEADEAAAERIARALEEAPAPSPVAVGVFDLGKGRSEVFASRLPAARR